MEEEKEKMKKKQKKKNRDVKRRNEIMRREWMRASTEKGRRITTVRMSNKGRPMKRKSPRKIKKSKKTKKTKQRWRTLRWNHVIVERFNWLGARSSPRWREHKR